MIQEFINSFKPDRQNGTQTLSNCHSDESIRDCLAGLSFENGLYRFYTDTEGKRWTDVVLSVFHQYKSRISCFASDWLGRQFATDSARLVDNQPQILMFQVGLGEVFEIPSSIEKFHADVLVNMPDPTLEKTMYKSWLEAGNVAPQRSQCVGYKVPLFWGGQIVLII